MKQPRKRHGEAALSGAAQALGVLFMLVGVIAVALQLAEGVPLHELSFPVPVFLGGLGLLLLVSGPVLALLADTPDRPETADANDPGAGGFGDGGGDGGGD